MSNKPGSEGERDVFTTADRLRHGLNWIAHSAATLEQAQGMATQTLRNHFEQSNSEGSGSERRWTIRVCDKGHIEKHGPDGVCWACYPGGKRTWEPGEPRQTEPNTTRIEVVPASERDQLRERVSELATKLEEESERHWTAADAPAYKHIAERIRATLTPSQPETCPACGSDNPLLKRVPCDPGAKRSHTHITHAVGRCPDPFHQPASTEQGGDTELEGGTG